MIRYREIPGWDGYKAGSDGSIWSNLQRNGAQGSVWHKLNQYPVRIAGRKPRYLRVWLYSGRVRYGKLVHHLVLMAFVGPRPNKKEARHLNDNGHDNRLENLAWGTREENYNDRRQNGNLIRGERSGRAILTETQVLAARQAVRNGSTIRSVAASLGVLESTMHSAVTGENWKHLPGAVPVSMRKHSRGGKNK